MPAIRQRWLVLCVATLAAATGCGYGLRPVCRAPTFASNAVSADPPARDGSGGVWYDPGDTWSPSYGLGAWSEPYEPNEPALSYEGEPPDGHGCFECRVVCTVDTPTGVLYREATGASGANYGDACGVAEQVLAHWAHFDARRPLAACSRDSSGWR